MAAKAQDNRFQNLTIDYHKVMTLTPTKRVEMTDTTEGRSLLTSLTPQQLQTAFPYQYGRDDPTGEKLRSITTGKAQQPQAGDKPELSESTRERLGGNRGRSDPGARAQLTKEQKEKAWFHPFRADVKSESFDKKGLIDYFKLGIPSTGMLCLEWWAFEIMTLFAAYISLTATASQVIVLNVAALFFMPILGL
jgi:hypothetical protein